MSPIEKYYDTIKGISNNRNERRMYKMSYIEKYYDTIKGISNNRNKIRSFFRNKLKCPSDYIREADYCIRAIQKASKTDNKLLFEEAVQRLFSDYETFCDCNELFKFDDNRRWKKNDDNRRRNE